MLDGLYYELTGILNRDNVSFMVYADREKEAMESLGAFVKRTTHCCDEEEGREGVDFRDFIQYDSLITLEVYLDNSCNANKLNDVALLSSIPTMPIVEFRIKVKDTFCFGYFNAVLKVYYKRQLEGNAASLSRNDSVVFVMENLIANNLYRFNFGDVIQGGRADLTINDKYGNKVAVYFFTIKGINPKVNDVYYFIDDMGYSSDYKMFKKFITLEPGLPLPKYLSDKLKQFNPYDMSHKDLYKNWNAYSRCPNLSNNGDGGWGLGQLTKPKPSSQALWDWKQNVIGSYLLIDDDVTSDGKRRVVRDKLNADMLIVDKWDSYHPNNLVKLIDTTYGGIKWRYAIIPPFNYPASSYYDRICNYFKQPINSDKEFSFLDACVIMAYNGYKGNKIGGKYVNFLYIHENNNDKPEWYISDNYYNYVEKVSEIKIPQH